MAKLTPQDRRVLAALAACGAWDYSEDSVAKAARLTTAWPGETARRHLQKLARAGLCEQVGTKKYPSWTILAAGRAALGEQPK